MRPEIGKDLGVLRSFIAKYIDIFLVLILATISSIIFFSNLGNAPMLNVDEQVHFQWASHIVSSGDYLTPWAYGNIFLWIGKPPLIIWLMSFSLRVFDTNFATRFWSAFFGVLCSILVFYIGKHLFNRIMGLLSATILLTFSIFYTFARVGLLDVPLAFFLTGSIYFFMKSENSRKETQYVILSSIFFGLALMTKQLSALLIPIIVFCYLLITRKNLRFLLRKPFALFVGIGLLIFSPWVILMTIHFGTDFLRIYFYNSVFQRATTVVESKSGGFLFYINYLIASENRFWVILLPFAFALSLRHAISKHKKEHILLIVWIMVVLGLFSISQTKISQYIIPIFPAFAIILGSLFYDLFRRLKSRAFIPIFVLIVVLLIAPLSSIQPQLSFTGEKHWEYLGDSEMTSIALLPSVSNFPIIVTGGNFNNESVEFAELNILNFTGQTFEILASNNSERSTNINCIATGDVNGDNQTEIVSVGTRNYGFNKVAQLNVWNSSSLKLENKTEWNWGADTTATALAIGSLSGKDYFDIVTAGTFFNGSCTVALLSVWNGRNLSIEKTTTWATFGNTTITSIAIADVDVDGLVEIIVGGYCLRGDTEISQVTIWDSSLSIKMMTGDYPGWTSLWKENVRIETLAISDVDGDGSLEIVTGGYCYQTNSRIAQITVWNGKDLSPKKSNGWSWYNWSSVNSLIINQYGLDKPAEIISAGSYFNGTNNFAQIMVWDESSFALKTSTAWSSCNGSLLNVVTAVNDMKNGRTQILTGGGYYNGTKEIAQIVLSTFNYETS